MKAYKPPYAILLLWLIITSCTRKEFFTKDCNNILQIPAYEDSNNDWKLLNEKILQEYKKCLSKPKIVGGAKGVVIYRSLPKHQQSVEQMICEYWKSN